MSLVDRHFNDETDKLEIAKYGPHCMDGTEGWKKIPESLVERYILVPSGNVRGLYDAQEYPQVIFEKQSVNAFYSPDNLGGNLNLFPFLQFCNPKKFLVRGVCTEICVIINLEELIRKFKEAEYYVVVDAVKALNKDEGRKVLEALEQRKNVNLVTTHWVLKHCTF